MHDLASHDRSDHFSLIYKLPIDHILHTLKVFLFFFLQKIELEVCFTHLNLLMWRMFVGLTDISWAVTLAMACTVAVDGHTCFLFVAAATNTYKTFHSRTMHELKVKEMW